MGSVRILHVDNDSSFTTLVEQFLTRENDRFELAAEITGSDALDRLEAESFDCIVSDYEMPQMDGLELLEAVRERGHEIPFIMFTGSGNEDVASEAISAGVTDYITRSGGTEQYTLLANRIEAAVERHRSQRELAATRRRLSLFVDQSPFGVIQWTSDAEIRQVNETAQRLLGYEESTLQGRSWETLFPERRREAVGEVVEALLAGEDEAVERHVAETLTEDGETILCEWHNQLVTDEGTVVGGFSQFQDVTERIETRRRFEMMVDNLPGIVYRHREADDLAFDRISGSCEALTGYTAAELRDEVSLEDELVHPDDREHVRETLAAQNAGERYELTYRIRRKDGDVRRIWEHGQRYESTREGAQFREGLLIDITELKPKPRQTA